jgi:hypothetical protein
VKIEKKKVLIPAAAARAAKHPSDGDGDGRGHGPSLAKAVVLTTTFAHPQPPQRIRKATLRHLTSESASKISRLTNMRTDLPTAAPESARLLCS